VEVAKGFFDNLVTLGSGVAHPLILLAILAILLRWQVEERHKLPALIASATLTLMFLSYCVVFLITPTELMLMLGSTFDRLMLQVWPSFLLVFFILLRGVADPAPVAPAKIAEARKSPVRSGKLAGKKVQ
jgi:hypothetical protein